MIFSLGDTVITRKAHPCGGNEWTVVRTGADIRMQCKKCGSFVMIDALKLEKRVKSIVRAEAKND